MKLITCHISFTIIEFLFLFLYPNQSAALSSLPDRVIIAGKIAGAGSGDTITLLLKKEFIYGSIGTEIFSTTCNKEGNFSFIFNASHIAMVSLILNKENPFISYQYVEPGDRINCVITKSSDNYTVKYSGRGIEKFSCMAALAYKRKQLNGKPFSKTRAGLFSKDSSVNALVGAFRQSDETAAELLVVLKKYKNKVSNQMMNLLTADILGESGRDKCFLIPYFLQKSDSEQRMAIKRFFINDVYLKGKTFVGSAAYSGNYIEFLYRRCQQLLVLKNKEGYSINELYNLLFDQYAGFIRERVLCSFLLRGHTGIDNNEYQTCLQKAIMASSTPIYRDYLLKQFERSSIGAPAFNFSLPGIDGKLVSLNELKDKIVLVDFWFTGCSACKVLAESLEKKVIPNFSNSEVVFVSICLDKDKAQWLNSLKKGGYSSGTSINLFTAGLAFEHPLVKHYNIEGCPALLLIDKKSKIISVSPPREPVALISELKKALTL